MSETMNDEDINPTFPALEGSWVRKELIDALRAENVGHPLGSLYRRGDDGKLGDVVPGRRHGRAHDIGGKGEFQRKQDPGGESQPDLPALHLVGRALED